MIAVQHVNPAGVFFLAAYSESLFAMLTLMGHAFIARGWYFDCFLRSKGRVAEL
jgi:hypothetical protein